MIEKIDQEFENNKEEKIKDLIKDILSLKRQKEKEGNDESEEIKLARRLEERSNEKLSEEILNNIISRYEIDNNKLPTRKILITLMINYLGNIQKSPENYTFLKICKDNIKLSGKNRIGRGLNGEIFAIRPKDMKSKKEYKCFAFKKHKVAYPLNIHISSAILLALYDFQPKYYNGYIMEINEYKNKNIERIFKDPIHEQRTKINENEISWYILYNFTNIRDQVNNMMQRKLNNDYIKIDINTLNSESATHKIGVYLDYFDRFKKIFLKYRTKVINELNKLLIINPDFIVDLIKFKTERGCFKIPNDILANQIDCLSSCYNVIKINKKEGFLDKIVKKCKLTNNDSLIFWANPAFSWMLFRLSENNILTKNEYNDYIDKFIKKAKIFKEISNKIKGDFIGKDIIIFENIKKEKEVKMKMKDEDEEDDKDKDEDEDEDEKNNSEIEKNIKTDDQENEELDIIKKEEIEDIDIKEYIIVSPKKSPKKNMDNPKKKFSWFCCGEDSVEVL